jgi:hypothetical protein
MDWTSPARDWALAYLVGIGDIEIAERDAALHVQRKISRYPLVAST